MKAFYMIIIIICIWSFIGLFIYVAADAGSKGIVIDRLRQDSISTHAENAKLKRQLQKANSDTTHKHCINLKPE